MGMYNSDYRIGQFYKCFVKCCGSRAIILLVGPGNTFLRMEVSKGYSH